jgi:hypothetical protein
MAVFSTRFEAPKALKMLSFSMPKMSNFASVFNVGDSNLNRKEGTRSPENEELSTLTEWDQLLILALSDPSEPALTQFSSYWH